MIFLKILINMDSHPINECEILRSDTFIFLHNMSYTKEIDDSKIIERNNEKA